MKTSLEKQSPQHLESNGVILFWWAQTITWSKIQLITLMGFLLSEDVMRNSEPKLKLRILGESVSLTVSVYLEFVKYDNRAIFLIKKIDWYFNLNKLFIKGWLPVKDIAPQSYSTIYYNGTDYGCSISHDQCYWDDLKSAQGHCSEWSECNFIYQSDQHPPAINGAPVYWARRYADSIDEKGAVLWKQQGNKKKVNKRILFHSVFV